MKRGLSGKENAPISKMTAHGICKPTGKAYGEDVSVIRVTVVGGTYRELSAPERYSKSNPVRYSVAKADKLCVKANDRATVGWRSNLRLILWDSKVDDTNRQSCDQPADYQHFNILCGGLQRCPNDCYDHSNAHRPATAESITYWCRQETSYSSSGGIGRYDGPQDGLSWVKLGHEILLCLSGAYTGKVKRSVSVLDHARLCRINILTKYATVVAPE
jgi:hypothetical protein